MFHSTRFVFLTEFSNYYPHPPKIMVQWEMSNIPNISFLSCRVVLHWTDNYGRKSKNPNHSLELFTKLILKKKLRNEASKVAGNSQVHHGKMIGTVPLNVLVFIPSLPIWNTPKRKKTQTSEIKYTNFRKFTSIVPPFSTYGIFPILVHHWGSWKSTFAQEGVPEVVAPEEEIGDWNQGAARIQVSVEFKGVKVIFSGNLGLVLLMGWIFNFVWGKND